MKTPKFMPGDLVIEDNGYNLTITEVEFTYYVKGTQRWMVKCLGMSTIYKEDDLKIFDAEIFSNSPPVQGVIED